MDLLETLKLPEGKTLEFKRDLSSPDAMLKAIVAFANTAGGTLLVAVEDRTRHVRGVSDALDLEERVANLISGRIAPRLVPEIEILPWRRTQVLALQVHPSPSRPHYLTREGAADGVYVRVGSTNRRADAELIEELRRFARGEGFDEQPMPGLDSEALDFRVASESFAAFRKLGRRDLETLRLVAQHQGREVPTVGGMLLFGKDRERHFPDAWIQAGRFAGTDKTRTWIASRSALSLLAELRKRSPSLRSMPGTAPRSARFDGRTAGTCLPRRCARRSSMLLSTAITHSVARRSASRYSMTASRSRTPGSCPSASPSRIFPTASPSSATA